MKKVFLALCVAILASMAGAAWALEVQLPAGITSIGDYGFDQGVALPEISLPASVTSIGIDAFYKCSKLSDIVLSNCVETIGNYAFAFCSNLNELIIPNSVKKIGSYAFGDCSQLVLYCECSTRPSGWNYNWNSSNRPVYWYSETQPTTTGNYWHYVDGVVTKWE